MNGTYFKRLSRILVLAAVCVFFAPGKSEAVGPVTSRLNRVLLYFYNYGLDHTNTPNYVRYVRDLGIEHGFTVDTTRNSGVFTPANLANYDVIFLFSAYYFGRNMTTAQKTSVENWYAGNKGIACFHQCVRNEWGGTSPNWYDQLMGPTYSTYAGFGAGPVWVDSSAAGTDLGMSSNGTLYAPNTQMRWDDEWYTYTSRPETHPNTKRVLYTKRNGGVGFTHVGGRNWNSSQGDEITMAWSREIMGGRFVLSSFFHTDVPIAGKGGISGSRPDSLAKFIDGHYLGVLRHLAGYNGCTNPSNPNYNPKATHNSDSICNLPVNIRIADNDDRQAMKIGDLKVSVSGAGPHTVEIFTLKGTKVVSYRGKGPKVYSFNQIRSPGFYFVKVKASSGSLSKKIFLL